MARDGATSTRHCDDDDNDDHHHHHYEEGEEEELEEEEEALWVYKTDDDSGTAQHSHSTAIAKSWFHSTPASNTPSFLPSSPSLTHSAFFFTSIYHSNISSITFFGRFCFSSPFAMLLQSSRTSLLLPVSNLAFARSPSIFLPLGQDGFTLRRSNLTQSSKGKWIQIVANSAAAAGMPVSRTADPKSMQLLFVEMGKM
uniref:Uncharacterized protein n=1 Tax=Physcomitrium patens TaxID=3218 RepID=A0A7I4CM51_PHYPA